jgi:hypothetical protein
MAYEIIENDSAVMIHGNCFIDELVTMKPIIVEGDLVTNRVRATTLTVRHGSLLAGCIEATDVDVDILGLPLPSTFWADRARYIWLRPFKRLPDPSAWTSEASIRNVIEMFLWSELTTNVAPIERLLTKVSARPSCGRARVLFQYALEELRDTKSLTPLGDRVVMHLLDNDDLPQHWRF